MKKAIQIAYNEDFELKCKLASMAGFEYMSANLSEMLNKTEYEWEKITEDIGNTLAKYNLTCIQSHPYYYDLTLSSEIRKDELEFAMKQAIITSGKIGAKWCAFHPRSSLSTGSYHRQSFEDNKKPFSEYLELAKKHGTGIAAENLLVIGTIQPIIPFYCSDYDDLMELVDYFNDPDMQICWDTGHAHLMRFDQAAAIETLGSRIKCTHIHNNFRHDDEHLPVDQGNIPWEKVMGAFAKIGYDGPLTLETHCRYQTPELLKSFAAHNYATLEFLEGLMNK
ncbi:MAG: sugar phosphate isomerase/epimerase family protein [Acutalibacteraceae bacterium]|nr:sugar phosphate isomerase/epimerase family protein [Acutalibacteraceae bacterium]